MATPADHDREQARMDGEDAMARLAALSVAITRLTQAESLVTSLTAQLRQAKRQLKDRKWDVQGLILTERRRTPSSAPLGSSKRNGRKS